MKKLIIILILQANAFSLEMLISKTKYCMESHRLADKACAIISSYSNTTDTYFWFKELIIRTKHCIRISNLSQEACTMLAVGDLKARHSR